MTIRRYWCELMNNQQDKLTHLKEFAKPFFFDGSNTGVLLTHGLTASPTEMLSLGKFLHEKGFSVHGVRLAGHGTHYRDLPNYSYHDWIKSCTEGLDLLRKKCDTIIPIGISMGALLSVLLIHQNIEVNFKKLVLLAPAFGLKSKIASLNSCIKEILCSNIILIMTSMLIIITLRRL